MTLAAAFYFGWAWSKHTPTFILSFVLAGVELAVWSTLAGAAA